MNWQVQQQIMQHICLRFVVVIKKNLSFNILADTHVSFDVNHHNTEADTRNVFHRFLVQKIIQHRQQRKEREKILLPYTSSDKSNIRWRRYLIVGALTHIIVSR